MPGRLAIGNLRARCIVADGAQAAAIADRASKALRHEFPDAARRAFACWLDRADESVWVVRRVDLSVLAAADVPADAIATSVVMALGRALGTALSGEGEGVNVIRFENRAAYLASFMCEASAGDAWSRWYFAPLSGLKRLPTSCAIRTAITKDPSIGLQALRRLDATALARLTGVITSQDEALILESLVESEGDDAASDAHYEAAWNECRRQLHESPALPSTLIAVIRDDVMKGRGFLRALRQVESVLTRTGNLSAMQRAQFECAIDAGNWESTIVEDVGSAMSMPASILREIVAYTATAHRRPTPPSYVCNTATQFGGLFLIMREVRELRWGTATDPSLTRTLQWLTLAACAGGERLEQVLGDPVFRTIFGVPAAATLREIALQLRTVDARRCAEAVRAWQLDGPGLSRQPDEKPWVTVDRQLGLSSRWGHVFALAARRALGTFARRLPGFAAASPRYIWDNFLSADASVEHEEERVVVRYGRPPLHLVLTLTGMTRGLTAGEDLRGRPVVVFVKE